MTKQERTKVIRWLRSIPGTEYSITSLTRALEALESRKESPPTWMSNPDAVAAMGGEDTSKQEQWLEFLEAYPARKSYLEDLIAQRTRKVEQFWEVLDLLARENGLGAQAIRKKYYDQVRPDRDIFRYHLFCSEDWFYKCLRRGVRFYFDTLPDLFAGK